MITVDNTGGPTQGRIFISSRAGDGKTSPSTPTGPRSARPSRSKATRSALRSTRSPTTSGRTSTSVLNGLARYTPEYAQTTTFYSLDEQIAYRIAIDPRRQLLRQPVRGTTKYNEAASTSTHSNTPDFRPGTRSPSTRQPATSSSRTKKKASGGSPSSTRAGRKSAPSAPVRSASPAPRRAASR